MALPQNQAAKLGPEHHLSSEIIRHAGHAHLL